MMTTGKHVDQGRTTIKVTRTDDNTECYTDGSARGCPLLLSVTSGGLASTQIEKKECIQVQIRGEVWESEFMDQPRIRRRHWFHVGRQSQEIDNDGQDANYQRTIFQQQTTCLDRWYANRTDECASLGYHNIHVLKLFQPCSLLWPLIEAAEATA
ncbi:hypothetical protein MRX96_005041 [Rhipicephalus microplus]